MFEPHKLTINGKYLLTGGPTSLFQAPLTALVTICLEWRAWPSRGVSSLHSAMPPPGAVMAPMTAETSQMKETVRVRHFIHQHALAHPPVLTAYEIYVILHIKIDLSLSFPQRKGSRNVQWTSLRVRAAVVFPWAGPVTKRMTVRMEQTSLTVVSKYFYRSLSLFSRQHLIFFLHFSVAVCQICSKCHLIYLCSYCSQHTKKNSTKRFYHSHCWNFLFSF